MSDVLLTEEELDHLNIEWWETSEERHPAELRRIIAKAAARKALESVSEFDLLEFVNKSTQRNEAQNNMKACEDVGIPMACAAVEHYRAKIRAILAELGEE